MKPSPIVLFLAATLVGCATTLPKPTLEPLRFEAQPPAEPSLDENHFRRDRGAGLSEAQLQAILAAPVKLEEGARVGVVPVAGGYRLDRELPVAPVTAALAESLQQSGVFELASEVSADFPTEGGLGGLRELGARYRAEYLLLFRQRFADQALINPWALGYLTVVGIAVLPGTTLEVAGVLEGTLFDVKTGTILFSVLERVEGERRATPLGAERALDRLRRDLLAQATERLAGRVVTQCRRLVPVRPGGEAPQVQVVPPG